MFQVKCIEKTRDKNNNIISYKLIGNDRKIISVKTDDLKGAIKSGQIDVTNLTLTSDNRLIDKKSDTPSKPTTTPSSKQSINIAGVINRAKSMGYTLNTFDTDCGHKCYIASSPDSIKHIFIIPDNVKYIYTINMNLQCNVDKKVYEYISNIKGTLKVIGGENLISTQCMFENCKAQSIDLTSFNTSNVKYMDFMFDNCRAQSLDLSSFNTSNVINMDGMFWACEAQSIDLSSFNTSNVATMPGMFNQCKAQSLDLRSFDTSKVTNMSFMFFECKAKRIDLRSFDTSHVTDMQSMFDSCKAQSIDLRSFNTSNVTNMSSMFNDCIAYSIDLSSFNASKVADMSGMFLGCEAQIKVNDSKLKAQLRRNMG